MDAVDALDRTVLHEAADQGHAGIVKVLLAAGVDKEKTDRHKRTALHGAADDGHGEVVGNRLPYACNLTSLLQCAHDVIKRPMIYINPDAYLC